MPRLGGWPLVDELSDTMRDCLSFWPQGHFTDATRRALRKRGLVKFGGLGVPAERTALGERALAYLQRKEKSDADQ